MISTTLRRITLAFLLLAVAVAGGCGYSTASLHPTDVQTIYIPLSQSDEFRRGLEYEFHRELVRLIHERTDYRVVDRNVADTILVTKILDLQENVLTQDDRDEPIEVQVRLSVQYEWKNQRTGKVRIAGATDRTALYATAEGQTLRSAQTKAMHKLAELVIEKMEADW